MNRSSIDRPAILVLGPSGLDLARRLAVCVDGELHGRSGRVESADVAFDDIATHLRGLFEAGRPIIGLCAAGILIRLLASVIDDKHSEPPVVSVAENGSAVVPLLGGHHGANDLARDIASELGIVPAITTAGDVRFGIALDEPPSGWTLANPMHAKGIMARLLAGEAIAMAGALPWSEIPGVTINGSAALRLVATTRAEEGDEKTLVYHPKSLIVGVGCERGCTSNELAGLVQQTLDYAGLSALAVTAVVSIDLKADEPAVHAVADRLEVPARFFDVDAIRMVEGRLRNPSDLVRQEVGVAGVAEGAALAAVGDAGDLVVEKQKSRRATCAIAEAPMPVNPTVIGRDRGRLSVIGIGPGAIDWRTPEATRCLRAAQHWVGYGLYLDLASDLAAGKTEHRFALGEEEDRVRHALALAGAGHDVALICSGDPGIYAMASLVFEVLEQGIGVSDGTRRTEVIVVPGISAVQAAAARTGAPIGHDFCLISLSDLLTPWTAIEKRLHAAAEGDFVIGFYNPRSGRRKDQLVRALEILSTHRPPDTPVVIASNLGRPTEAISVVALADTDPEQVDMLSLVLVGSSASRSFMTGAAETRVYTPRGYDAKRKAAE